MLDFQFLIKRWIDISTSFAALILLSPLFFLISILIKTLTREDVIFRQKRVGKDGIIFDIYKFKTMLNDASYVKDGLAVSVNDTRITPIGKILRKTSLDELPQFINVLKGDISLVGPRPALPQQLPYYNDLHRQRLKMKPGITGLATIKGRCSIPWSRRIELDIFYIDNYSLWLDIKILALTVFVVLSGKDTYYDSSNGPAFDLAPTDDLPQATKKGAD